MKAYNRLYTVLTEHQFSRGTYSPRMYTSKDLMKKNWELMARHKKKTTETGTMDHPEINKRLKAHIDEFLFRKAAEKGDKRPGNRRVRMYHPRGSKG